MKCLTQAHGVTEGLSRTHLTISCSPKPPAKDPHLASTDGGEDSKPSETTAKCLQCDELEQKISRLKNMVALMCWGSPL